MPRRASNRVGVEVGDSVPAQEGDEESHADSSRDSFADGASQMKASASAQSLESAKAQRQKELLRKKKAERRAHAKQRAAEKEQRQEEKRQNRELLQMMEEDVPATELTNLVTRIATSLDCVEGRGDKAQDATEPDALIEGQQDIPEMSPPENATRSATLAEADGVQTAEHSAREQPTHGDDSSSTTEMVPKQRSGSSQPAKSANAAALTIQKALKKKYKKCKTMFRQSPRVFAEEMATPSLLIPLEAHADDDETARPSQPVELRTEIAMDTTLRGPPAECIVEASPFPVQFSKPVSIVPPLQLPPADPSAPVPRSRSSTTSSCSSSCSCSDSGSCLSCSCSSSSSSVSSSVNSRSSDEDKASRRRQSKRRSRTDRSPHDQRRKTHRHTARASRPHSHRSSGPSPSLLQQQSSGNVGKKYGEAHHYMATRIQALVRGDRGRARARQRRAELDQELLEEALQELQQEACLKIQSRARGVLVRKKVPISDKERRRRRRRRRSQLHSNESPGSPRSDGDNGMGAYEDPDEIGEWPEETDLEALDDWHELTQPASTLGDSVTQARFLSQGKLRVFCGTWNLHAKKPTDDLRQWIRLNKYHIVAVGSEECVNSIAKSVVFTSKRSWEDQLRGTLGDDYVLVASHALTAIHNVVFVHASILPLLGNIQSDAIATGLGNQLGNKGGVGVAFTVGATSFAFINSHFDAHQRNVSKRNGNFHRINHELRLSPTGSISSPKNSVAVAPSPSSPNGANLQGLGRTSVNRFSMPVGGAAAGSKRTISERFDRVFWYGDLNYRVNGTRRMVDTLLLRNQHEVLYANDQLQREMKAGNVFAHFKEGQLRFRPTYKFDKRSDVYDSSSKQRIPSWTDRVLYLSNDKVSDIEVLSYRSQTSFRTSDHRPVSAIFQVAFNAAGPRPVNSSQDNGVSSQTCTIQ